MEQPEYNLFHRDRVEREYKPLYDLYGLGTTIWSPLASGLLTGKYSQGIPADSRLARHPMWRSASMDARIAATRQLTLIAEEVGCSLAQLAIAWCLDNSNVSTVILGASHLEQLKENLGALEAITYLDQNIKEKLEQIALCHPCQ